MSVNYGLNLIFPDCVYATERPEIATEETTTTTKKSTAPFGDPFEDGMPR